jgi:hypothetical protein
LSISENTLRSQRHGKNFAFGYGYINEKGNDPMICINCGNTVDNGVLFCPFCGKKIEDMVDLEKKSVAVNDVFEGSAPSDAPFVPTAPPTPPVPPVPAFSEAPKPPVPPVPAFSEAPKPPVPPVPAFSEAPKPPVSPVPAFSEAPKPPVNPVPTYNPAPKPQPQPVQPVRTAPKKKKEFFGAGAFALCLAVIGILAASTGIFAYLYFSLLGVL